jgi:hypothetical protein
MKNIWKIFNCQNFRDTFLNTKVALKPKPRPKWTQKLHKKKVKQEIRKLEIKTEINSWNFNEIFYFGQIRKNDAKKGSWIAIF